MSISILNPVIPCIHTLYSRPESEMSKEKPGIFSFNDVRTALHSKHSAHNIMKSRTGHVETPARHPAYLAAPSAPTRRS